MRELNRMEQSLLTYLEVGLVDWRGKVKGKHMNAEDLDLARKWVSEGFISFKRLSAEEIVRGGIGGTGLDPYTHRVQFTDEAWENAHHYRRVRAERNSVATISAKDKCTVLETVVLPE